MHRIALTTLALSAAIASADTFDFTATLNGDQEVPPSGSTATGTATGTYDSDTNTFSFAWEIVGLLGTPGSPGAHIHDGDAGTNGPIVFGFASDAYPTSGSAEWSGLTTAQADDLFAGGYYFNFHTSQFPSGEVRGQILLVPAPTGLAALALGVPVCVRRRR